MKANVRKYGRSQVAAEWVLKKQMEEGWCERSPTPRQRRREARVSGREANERACGEIGLSFSGDSCHCGTRASLLLNDGGGVG